MRIFANPRRCINKKIVLECLDYYEENDIFLDCNENYTRFKKNLLKQKRITYKDVEHFIKETRGSNFSCFTKYNRNTYKAYHSFSNDTLSVEHNFNLENVIYIKPDFRDNYIDRKVSKIIEENINKKYLIIDLRQLGGGNVRNCAKICNLFLPQGNIFTQKFKNKNVTYIANEKYYRFDMILILVDNGTASSSEILAYALKSKLKNCNLIGYKTYGKTFGQDIITNKKYGFILSTVTFKWEIDDFSYEQAEIIAPCNNNYLKTVEQYFRIHSACEKSIQPIL